MRLEPPARAICITGFMGTGKTTVGRLLAQRLGIGFVDTDEVITEGEGRSIPDIFAQHGEEHFRELEARAVASVSAGGPRVISTGGGVLLREENLRALHDAGPIICLNADAETILERTRGDVSRPLLQTEDPAASIRALLSARQACYAPADYQLDASGSPDDVTAALLCMLAEDPRARWLVGNETVIPLDTGTGGYSVTVGRGLLARVGEIVPPSHPGVRAALVTSDRLAPLFAPQVSASLRSGGWEPVLLTVPDGEGSKQLAVLGELWAQMAEAGLDRGSTVFALGGGVIGDLAGFAAATFMRGIDLVHLPTSLLAQVDSSIGGKTAIDLASGKNLVGAFHQPVAVVSDVAALATLPEAELRSGLGEIIKHACCFDAEMFELMERRREAVLEGDPAVREYLVARNCQIKAEVVAEDPHEQGLRAVLNYGHTIGHALERAAPEWGLRHGEVVGAGIVAESRLAVWLGAADEETAARQEALVAAYGLPTSVEGIDEEAAVAAMARDKKIVSGRLRMPIVPAVGTFRLVDDIDIALVRRALVSVLR
ncbi:MAG: 3-dehydroquinate synthase [candidate division WS1 bacterium]|jgi:3-dehydroquinate synthase|nr:3-dehydroquinate synthase [candidate division WS1 bacterium]